MDLKITYNPINRRNIFTNGDIVKGQVTLDVRKSCQINSLSITFEVESKVQWDTASAPEFTTYHSEEKYFKLNHFFVQGKNLNASGRFTDQTYSKIVLSKCLVYPFSFQIPFQDLPASYHSSFGEIGYKLTAKLSRPMKKDKKHVTEINFVPRQDMPNNLAIMTPQHMTMEKKTNLFNSGKVSMDVKLEKSGFFQGEQLKVLAFIENNSSCEIKPKYRLYRKRIYFAKSRRKVDTKDLVKKVGEPIPRFTSQNVTKVITIPQDAEISILNCPNIRVEYKLRVFLDVEFASCPEIKFPIIILLHPSSLRGSTAETPQVPAVAPPPAFRSTSPPTRGLVPSAPQVVDLPPPYESHRLYPSLTNSGNK